MITLNSIWTSKRLIVEDIKLQEINAVQELYTTSSNLSRWDGREPDAEFINQCYLTGDLPPAGKKEDYKIQTIKLNIESRELIGFLSVYHGYPKDEIIYISFMCIGKQHQKQGYGQEIINQSIAELSLLQYKEIRVNVSLKNWPALRFWITLGFNQINGIFGDKEYAENTFSNIELSRVV
jgi:ribosomal protein S18 acetylase RimI-like enzyme